MKYLPVGLDLRGRICIVVGGGPVGARKISNLLKAGARVTLVSPAATEGIVQQVDNGELRWRRRLYRTDDLDGAALVVAATDDPALNSCIVADAQARRILVCDASSAARSQVIFGALHESGGVTVAVFTDGRNPSLARKARDAIAGMEEQWKDQGEK
jgi:precorrin-2 dehydrogenase/sirohydrochlorin ferrochelatase